MMNSTGSNYLLLYDNLSISHGSNLPGDRFRGVSADDGLAGWFSLVIALLLLQCFVAGVIKKDYLVSILY